MKLVTQEEQAGCGVACVASILKLKYRQAKKLFKKNSTKGYYCKELVSALRKSGKNYSYKKISHSTKKYLNENGTIVFIRKSKKYPIGHYLLKTKNGWMNSWINYPSIKPVKSGYNKKLPGKPQWILYNNKL